MNKNTWIIILVVAVGIAYFLGRSSNNLTKPINTIQTTNPVAVDTSWTNKSNRNSENTPTEIYQCTTTTVSKIGKRLDGNPNSGSYVAYADGVQQVSYDTIAGVENSQIGDDVFLCLISMPTDCPAGDNRGKNYTATNLRTGDAWRAQDSEHSCGGA